MKKYYVSLPGGPSMAAIVDVVTNSTHVKDFEKFCDQYYIIGPFHNEEEVERMIQRGLLTFAIDVTESEISQTILVSSSKPLDLVPIKKSVEQMRDVLELMGVEQVPFNQPVSQGYKESRGPPVRGYDSLTGLRCLFLPYQIKPDERLIWKNESFVIVAVTPNLPRKYYPEAYRAVVFKHLLYHGPLLISEELQGIQRFVTNTSTFDDHSQNTYFEDAVSTLLWGEPTNPVKLWVWQTYTPLALKTTPIYPDNNVALFGIYTLTKPDFQVNASIDIGQDSSTWNLGKYAILEKNFLLKDLLPSKTKTVKARDNENGWVLNLKINVIATEYCARCGSAFDPSKNEIGACMWHTTAWMAQTACPNNKLPIVPRRHGDYNPIMCGGVVEGDSTGRLVYACCLADYWALGCWRSKHITAAELEESGPFVPMTRTTLTSKLVTAWEPSVHTNVQKVKDAERALTDKKFDEFDKIARIFNVSLGYRLDTAKKSWILNCNHHHTLSRIIPVSLDAAPVSRSIPKTPVVQPKVSVISPPLVSSVVDVAGLESAIKAATTIIDGKNPKVIGDVKKIVEQIVEQWELLPVSKEQLKENVNDLAKKVRENEELPPNKLIFGMSAIEDPVDESNIPEGSQKGDFIDSTFTPVLFDHVVQKLKFTENLSVWPYSSTSVLKKYKIAIHRSGISSGELEHMSTIINNWPSNTHFKKPSITVFVITHEETKGSSHNYAIVVDDIHERVYVTESLHGSISQGLSNIIKNAFKPRKLHIVAKKWQAAVSDGRANSCGIYAVFMGLHLAKILANIGDSKDEKKINDSVNTNFVDENQVITEDGLIEARRQIEQAQSRWVRCCSSDNTRLKIMTSEISAENIWSTLWNRNFSNLSHLCRLDLPIILPRKELFDAVKKILETWNVLPSDHDLLFGDLMVMSIYTQTHGVEIFIDETAVGVKADDVGQLQRKKLELAKSADQLYTATKTWHESAKSALLEETNTSNQRILATDTKMTNAYLSEIGYIVNILQNFEYNVAYEHQLSWLSTSLECIAARLETLTTKLGQLKSKYPKIVPSSIVVEAPSTSMSPIRPPISLQTSSIVNKINTEPEDSKHKGFFHVGQYLREKNLENALKNGFMKNFDSANGTQLDAAENEWIVYVGRKAEADTLKMIPTLDQSNKMDNRYKNTRICVYDVCVTNDISSLTIFYEQVKTRSTDTSKVVHVAFYQNTTYPSSYYLLVFISAPAYNQSVLVSLCDDENTKRVLNDLQNNTSLDLNECIPFVCYGKESIVFGLDTNSNFKCNPDPPISALVLYAISPAVALLFLRVKRKNVTPRYTFVEVDSKTKAYVKTSLENLKAYLETLDAVS